MDVFVRRSQPDIGFIDIRPGDWVVIKPNLVKESKDNDPSEWECVITSPALISLVCDHVCRRLEGKGRVTICDAPQTDSSFQKIAQLLDLSGIAARCRKEHSVEVEILDLRNEEWVNEAGIITRRNQLPGDPRGAVVFNLGKQSLLYAYRGEGRYYGADYDSKVVNGHHRGEVHEYLVCATPVLADVFINLPKLKTHKKTGVTLSLKNLVGINADKNWLPHHTLGSPRDGGDQFPNRGTKQMLEQWAVRFARRLALDHPGLGPKISQKLRGAGVVAFGAADKVIRSGNWHGNDTTWRMVLDLNRCLLYGNPDGTLRRDNPKRYYTLIDGIVGMDGMGPMQGEPARSGVVIGGTDPVAVDMVAARVMGFDWRKIPLIREAFSIGALPVTRSTPEEVNVVSDIPDWNGTFFDVEKREFLVFRPHFGWIGHIEYEPNP
jgi:uncharacterized protein (DUF362 family)